MALYHAGVHVALRGDDPVDHAANSQRLAGDGGDWRAVVVQLSIIVFGVFFYLPFLKVAERVALKNSGTEH